MQTPLGIVGAGALGQVIALSLEKAGFRVWLLATPNSAAALRARGSIEISGAMQASVAVGAAPAPGCVGLADAPGQVDAVGGLVFATKAHQLEAAARFWAPVAPDWVAGIQNGMAKDDILAGVFGWEKVIGAATIIGAQRPESGQIIFSQPGRTYFGAFGEAVGRHDLSGAVAGFNQAGLPCEEPADIRSVEWSKAANAAATFALSLLSRLPWSRSMIDPDMVAAYVSLAREVASIAAAEGSEIGDYAGFPVRRYVNQDQEVTLKEFTEAAARLPQGAEIVLSMHQDLRAGRPLEVEQVFGDLVRRAAKLGVDVPRLELAYRIIRRIDPARAS